MQRILIKQRYHSGFGGIRLNFQMNPHGMFDTTNPHMYMDIIKPIMAKVEAATCASILNLYHGKRIDRKIKWLKK